MNRLRRMFCRLFGHSWPACSFFGYQGTVTVHCAWCDATKDVHP